ncbi:MAG: CDGSH iron-sulfur domain-containing protein [Alphaproteobacteria bacterium]|nr:CDGSH iron-sulfur domain-containing protein [Alphaproteobacteria bacterium]
MSGQPVVAEKGPKAIQVEAGKTYDWCTCRKSTNQPFCNGPHKGTSITPMAWPAEETKTVSFRECKHTGRASLCNGSHSNFLSADAPSVSRLSSGAGLR